MLKNFLLVVLFLSNSLVFFTPAFGAVTPLSGVISVSAGIDFSCAVRTDGAVFCWGLNDAGQLGTPTPTASNGGRYTTNPVKVTAMSGATMVASGWGHTCVIRSDGSAWCWGINFAGQLGNGTRVDSLVPVKVIGVPPLKSIVAGDTAACAISFDDRLWCWGDFYELNGGFLTGVATDQLGVPVNIRSLSNVRSVALGYENACAVLYSGQAYCWGGSGDGQIGDGKQSDYPKTPQLVSSLANVESIAVGYGGVCAARTDGQLFCWGSHPDVGNGDSGSVANVPMLIDVGHSLSALFWKAGICGLNESGGAFCWGATDNRLGAGNPFPYVYKAGTVTPLIGGPASAFAMGRNHACALMLDTTVKCWGGAYGLGAGIAYGGEYPQLVLLAGVISNVYAGVVADPGDQVARTLSITDDIVVFASVVGANPTGTVDFFDGAANRVCSAIPVTKQNMKYEYGIGSAESNYRARCDIAKAARLPGSLGWTARYNGDVNHTSSQSALATIELKVGPARLRNMVEFRNVALDYYFITSRQNEIDLLDAAKATGWERTGVKFRVATQQPSVPTGSFATNALNRFYFDKVALGQSRGSHFYTKSDADKDALHALNPGNLQVAGKPFDEGIDSFVYTTPSGSGSCAFYGLISVFRMFRTKADDPNHRYVLDPVLVDSMQASGWRFESTAFCAVP